MTPDTDHFLARIPREGMADILRLKLSVLDGYWETYHILYTCYITLSVDKSGYDVLVEGPMYTHPERVNSSEELDKDMRRQEIHDKTCSILAEVCKRSSPKGLTVEDIYSMRMSLEDAFR